MTAARTSTRRATAYEGRAASFSIELLGWELVRCSPLAPCWRTSPKSSWQLVSRGPAPSSSDLHHYCFPITSLYPLDRPGSTGHQGKGGGREEKDGQDFTVSLWFIWIWVVLGCGCDEVSVRLGGISCNSRRSAVGLR